MIARRVFLVLACLIALVSLANALRPVRQMLRRPRLIEPNSIAARQYELVHARTVVLALNAEHLAYFDEEPGWQTIEAVGEYYAVQYALAPALLRRDSADEPFALVNFRLTRKPTPRPGYTLIEDLGSGLALYRKP